MKKLFLLMLIISSVASAQNNSTLSNEGLHGKVKVLLLTEYEVDDKFGKLIKGKIKYVDKYFYNDRGYKKKLIIYGTDGKPHDIVEYYYNSKDELNKYTIFDAWQEEPKNDILELYDNRLFVLDFFYIYDKKGNVIEDNRGIFYSEISSYSGKNKYYYDNNNRTIKRELYWENNPSEINRSWEYSWDSNGNLIELTETRGGGLSWERWVNNYDSNNDMINSTSYNKKGIRGSKWSWEYLEYDVNKNWVKRIVYKNDNPLVIVERDIKYHK